MSGAAVLIRRSGVALAIVGLVACSTPPARPVHRVYRPSPAPAQPAPPPPPQTQVYFYPTQGQPPVQQSQDKYECHLWAVKQSGFDPSRTQLAVRHRVEYVAMPPPHHDTVAGAVTGAVIGAAVSRPRNAGEGAVVGAVAGGMIGAASDASRRAEADRIEARQSQRDAQREARLQAQADGYRRAMGACLQGRGYSVQ